MSLISARVIVPVLIGVWSSTAVAQTEPASPIGHFEITRFAVTGNTLLPDATISAVVSPFTGKDRDFGYVQKALEALEDEYHKRGYSVVQVVLPEQELNKGVVQFKVIEAKIGKVTLEGNKFFSDANILASLPSLKTGSSPNIGQISRELKLANENPSKKVNLQLQSSTQDDTVNAGLKVVDQKPWTIGSYVDNTGDSASGRNHLSLQFQHANMFDSDQILSVQYTTSLENPGSVHVYGLGYHIPLYSIEDSLDFFASYSDVNSGTVAAGPLDLAVSGKGAVYGGRFNQTLTRSSSYESRLIYGLDYKAYKSDVFLQNVQLGNDVTVHPASLTYTGTVTEPWGEASYSLGVARNIPGGDNGDSAAFALARHGATSSYTLVRYGFNLTRFFEKGWQLHAAINGQLTGDALVPGEQFGLGGASSVRGYREREVSNDKGILGNLELYTPNLCGGEGSTQCRLLGFVDAGHVSRNQALPGEQTQATLSSFGFGVRVNFDRYVAMQMDYARAQDSSDLTSKGDSRLHFRMGVNY